MSYYVRRDPEEDAQEGVDAFDAAYFARFGRYPEESTATAPIADSRREAIMALIERGATEGEREAARAALERLDEAEYEDALAHGEA